jgi:hypothetical protein
MRCTCSDSSHSLEDFLQLSSILHTPLAISETTQDTYMDSFDVSGGDGEAASPQQ